MLSRSSRAAWVVAFGLALAPGLFVACGGAAPIGSGENDAGDSDAGDSDAGMFDAGVSDAGAADAGESEDGGRDAGAADAGEREDAGPADAGEADAGRDAGSIDAGEPDAGAADAGREDAGPADAGRDAGEGADAGEPSDAGEPIDGGAQPECEWGGAPGSCDTASACSAMPGYTAKTANTGACASTELCCIVTPSTSSNPPVPSGWKLMSQSQVTSAMTTWAVDILHDPITYPMFATTEMTFGTLLVLARVEWHPPDFQNSIIHRGVTLYVPSG